MKKWVECLKNIENESSTLKMEEILTKYFSEVYPKNDSNYERDVLQNIFDLHLNYKINSFITDVKVLGRDLKSFYYTINYNNSNTLVSDSESYFRDKIYNRLKNKTLKLQHDSNSYRFSKGEWCDVLLELATRCHSEDEFNYYIRAITKDLKIGASIKIYNKVANKLNLELIPEFECMKVHDISEASINYDSGAFVSTKYDGVNASFIDGQFYSRNGQVIPLLHIENYFNSIKNELKAKDIIDIDDFVFCGELVSSTRQSSSGLVNSAIKMGYETQQPVIDLNFYIFDIVRKDDYVNGNGKDIFRKRLDYIDLCIRYFPLPNDYVKFVEHKLVYSEKEARDIYSELISNNCEGIIINDWNGVYEKKRSKKRARIKIETTNEFEIIGYEIHKRKSHWIGSIKVKSACGKIISDVGSGFDEETREHFFNNMKEFLGSIVEIKYNSIIPNNNSEGYTLFLPVFIRHRLDKDVADNFNF